MNDRYWMQRAYQQALLAQGEGEVPVGAVLVKENQLISESRNALEQSHDPSDHAECRAIRQAAHILENHRLTYLYQS